MIGGYEYFVGGDSDMGQAEKLAVCEAIPLAPMHADGLSSVVVIGDTMHVQFYEDQATADGSGVERVLSGRLAIKMSGVPHGPWIVSQKAAGYGIVSVANQLPAPDQMMSIMICACALLEVIA